MVITFELANMIARKKGKDSRYTAETYSTESEKLFQEWKANVDTQGTPFITDGVMDPKEWFSQGTRPLFLMKEAYGGDQDWDLAKDHVLTNEKCRKIWKRISLWAMGLLEDDVKLLDKYDPNKDILQVFGNKYLRKIAAVN